MFRKHAGVVAAVVVAACFVIYMYNCGRLQRLRDTLAANDEIAKIRDKERAKALKELGTGEVR